MVQEIIYGTYGNIVPVSLETGFVDGGREQGVYTEVFIAFQVFILFYFFFTSLNAVISVSSDNKHQVYLIAKLHETATNLHFSISTWSSGNDSYFR